jgi:N-dimethylarginine dimethylaminohydrolase
MTTPAPQAACPVRSHNEWDQLEEVLLGSAEHARVSQKDVSIRTVDYPDFSADEWERAPTGAYPRRVIEETREDLERFAEQLAALGIVVRRPDPVDFARTHGNGRWTSEGYNAYCPRDSCAVFGDALIETPMVVRARYHETFAYRRLFREYSSRGARWFCAPKPLLDDDLYEFGPDGEPRLGEHEPAFDAANVVRCGEDVFYLVSNSGNVAGARWLRTALGERYRVHVLEGLYTYTHVDTTLLPLRPGLLLANAARVSRDNLPAPFRRWDVLWFDAPVDDGAALREYGPSSIWLAMNVLSLSPGLVAVDEKQAPLIAGLRAKGIEALPVRLRHARTMRGGPHCVTLDVRRKGALECYFDRSELA